MPPLGLGLLGLVPVAQERRRRTPRTDLAHAAGRDRPSPLVLHLDFHARHRAAESARYPVHLRAVAGGHHQVALRLPVDLVDRRAEGTPRPPRQLRAQRLPPRHDRAEGETGRNRRAAHRPKRGGRQEGAGDPLVPHQGQRLLRIELREPPCHQRHAVEERGHRKVHEPTDPGPVRGGPRDVPRPWHPLERGLHRRQVPQEEAVGVQHALRIARGPRGIDHRRGVVRPRPHRRASALARKVVRVEPQVQRRQVEPGELVQALPLRDDRHRARVPQAVRERVRPEEREERQRHRAEPERREMRHYHLRALRQEDRHAVAALDAARGESRGQGLRRLPERRAGPDAPLATR